MCAKRFIVAAPVAEGGIVHRSPHLKWIRDFYRDVYRSTGGVPAVPDPAVPAAASSNTDGCYVNYPDVDLDDPTLNTSGQSAYQLYYKNNYARLQRTKKHWDPHNVFRRAQSIRRPASHTAVGDAGESSRDDAGVQTGP
ncbi:BBE domain-containing protein [Streptomyces tibetensis]|uniref:BBE domain-containing protein n=1 Tax=Streptomyces tibetensis TaxID=2382123 RepID=UPI003F541D76